MDYMEVRRLGGDVGDMVGKEWKNSEYKVKDL